MGMMIINAMTRPMTIIPSVEPISERSCGGGVVVGCRKNAAAPRFPCMAGGAEYVNAALNNARTSPSPIVMMGRTNLFISLLPLALLITKRLQKFADQDLDFRC